MASAAATTTATKMGSWLVTLPPLAAARSVVIEASDGKSQARLASVAVGDVLLCGGQSNMGFGMCASRSKHQTAQQALDNVTASQIRFLFYSSDAGSGPGGGTAEGICKTSAGLNSTTPGKQWFTATATNAGGASANCLLSAQYLAEHLGPGIPVGAVESCEGGTKVASWTPPKGALFLHFIKPLAPMNFKAVLWDQGENDVCCNGAHTNATWYRHEFPLMIQGWRTAFGTPRLPFIYVELPREFGGYEPRTRDFWLAQRSAIALPATGFVTTTDIERALHPPDKQDVARRLVLELRRVAYGEGLTARGPEMISLRRDTSGDVVLTFSNKTLETHAGIYVGVEATCAATRGTAKDMVVTVADANSTGGHGPQHGVPYSLDSTKGSLTIAKADCTSGSWLWVSADISSCFLYGPARLPAPPLFLTCPPAVVEEWPPTVTMV